VPASTDAGRIPRVLPARGTSSGERPAPTHRRRMNVVPAPGNVAHRGTSNTSEIRRRGAH